MSNVTRIRKPVDHSPEGIVDHVQHDKRSAGILLTWVGDGWEWRFYGDRTVVEMVGAMEMVKHDMLTKDMEKP